jgi:hypothetical protein
VDLKIVDCLQALLKIHQPEASVPIVRLLVLLVPVTGVKDSAQHFAGIGLAQDLMRVYSETLHIETKCVYVSPKSRIKQTNPPCADHRSCVFSASAS